MINETDFFVKFYEIDGLGIVHHSNYPLWFELGRNDYFKNADIPIYKMNYLGLFLPLLEMNCNFKSPARFGDEIQLVTKIIDLSIVKIKFEYQVINKIKGDILVTGRTVHAWTNIKLEPLNLEKTAPKVYNKLINLVESSDLT